MNETAFRLGEAASNRDTKVDAGTCIAPGPVKPFLKEKIMATSSILGGSPAPAHAQGKDNDALGPSDSSDSGSDVQGERSMATQPDDESMLGGQPVELTSDTDMTGTGERAGAIPDGSRDARDILPDHVERLPENDAKTGTADADGDSGSIGEESAGLVGEEPGETDR